MSTIDRLSDLAPTVPVPGIRVDGSPPAGHDWEEVAGALAQLDGPGCQLLRGMYCHDARALRQALARLQGVALLAVATDELELEDGAVGRLALATLQAFVARGLCGHCGGRGWRMEEDLRVTCLECNGEGKAHPNEAMLLRGANVPRVPEAFGLFAMLFERLKAWHRDGWGQLSQQLSNRDPDD